MRITAPLRGICAHAIKFPERIIDIEEDILRLFAATEEFFVALRAPDVEYRGFSGH